MITLKTHTQEACEQWRTEHPACRDWSDIEVIEALMMRLCETNPERVTKHTGLDGVIRFSIKPAAPLG